MHNFNNMENNNDYDYDDQINKRAKQMAFTLEIIEKLITKFVLMYLVIIMGDYYNNLSINFIGFIGLTCLISVIIYTHKFGPSILGFIFMSLFETLILYFIIKINKLSIIVTILFNIIGILIGYVIKYPYIWIFIILSFIVLFVLNIINLYFKKIFVVNLFSYMFILVFMMIYIYSLKIFYKNNINKYTINETNIFSLIVCMHIYLNLIDDIINMCRV